MNLVVECSSLNCLCHSNNWSLCSHTKNISSIYLINQTVGLFAWFESNFVFIVRMNKLSYEGATVVPMAA